MGRDSIGMDCGTVETRSRFKSEGCKFETADDGKTIKWVHDGMTPLAALKLASEIMEEEQIKMAEDIFEKKMTIS